MSSHSASFTTKAFSCSAMRQRSFISQRGYWKTKNRTVEHSRMHSNYCAFTKLIFSPIKLFSEFRNSLRWIGSGDGDCAP
jgi:hypothetical protein